MTDEQQSEGGKATPNKTKPGVYIAVGAAVGVALGVALSNILLGIGMGIAFGAAIATNEGRKQRGEDNQDGSGDD